ncbi:hypothetical protein A2961_04480 [Candidatus Woesebacteria bacterium RIFCSPLOWO2_01_FULL_39_21]|uniref:Peptidase M20 dimerisation domain-containing protein n=1 Tax=Candidatus Woesebacteria bacterium RIFCSPLOWO2_01_FULL_39_21 TaxID=1802519 RepID=A0A1F8BCJ4_9BACT|nr:MAG: hypothetical protein A2961_04480 [Candidatus Woesebacteria bacterium RIFCSPLOWO2_01_FULL_39_21]
MELKEELITFTSQLIGFKTVSPNGDEYLCLPFITRKLREINAKVYVVSKSKNRPNVVGEIGRNGFKSLVIACHMDVVAAGSGWVSDPFKALVKNGRIYGRGAVDDKGPYAISYCAVKKFIQKYPKFRGKIYLLALADEEADNVYGVKYLLKKGFKADAGLIPDGGYFSRLDVGEKGCLQLRIESFGKQAHSALDEYGENALSNLTGVVEKIKLINWFRKFDKRFTKTKVNFSLFHGGEIPNTVPPYAYVQMDIRYPLGVKSDKVFKKVKNMVDKSKGKFKLKIVYKTEPHLVKDKNLISVFISSAKEIGVSIKPITLAGNSVAKEFNQAGIPSIVHYPMDYLPIHEPNEYIEIDSMVKTIELYYEFLKNYFEVN